MAKLNNQECTKIICKGADGTTKEYAVVDSSSGTTEVDLFEGLCDFNQKYTEYSNSKITRVYYGVFACCPLEKISLPNCTSVSGGGFQNNSKLKVLDTPKVTAINGGILENCSGIEIVSFPILNTINNNGNFKGCTKLKLLDLGLVGAIGNCFQAANIPLQHLILRKTDTPATWGQWNDIPTAMTNGTCSIYVPRALLSEYPTNSYWSKVNVQWKALEDYTVDGTTTGALTIEVE